MASVITIENNRQPIGGVAAMNVASDRSTIQQQANEQPIQVGQTQQNIQTSTTQPPIQAPNYTIYFIVGGVAIAIIVGVVLLYHPKK